MGDSPIKKLVIPSKLDEIVPVQNAILDEVRAADFSKQSVFAIQLALDEALANAVRHGNKLDPEKSVTVEFSVDQKQVFIRITDQGPGFKPDDLADPTEEENLILPHGRGVMLMRAYMTDVSFNEKGNQVTLIKERDCSLPETG